MAELTAKQQQEIDAAVSEVLQADLSTGGAALAPAPSLDIGDLKDAFCKNWDKVKMALNFIASVPGVPQNLKDAINRLIAIGDRIHKIVCG